MTYNSRLFYLGPLLCLLSMTHFDQDGKFYLDPNWECKLDGKSFERPDGILEKKERVSGTLVCFSSGKTVFEATFKEGEVYAFKTIGTNKVVEETFKILGRGQYEIARFAGTLGHNPKQSLTQYNEKDQEHGTTQYYSQKGKLEKEQQFRDGELEGWSRTYYESGQLNLSEWYTKNRLVLSYAMDERQEKMLSLDCYSQNPDDYPSQDLQKLCGFNWPRVAHEIYTIKDGKIILEKKITFHKGKAQEEAHYKNNIISIQYKNTHDLSLKKEFNERGKLKVLEAYQLQDTPGYTKTSGKRLFKIGYVDGEVSRLECGSRAYFDEDRKLCGFDGETKVALHAFKPGTKNLIITETVIMKDGKVHKRKDEKK